MNTINPNPNNSGMAKEPRDPFGLSALPELQAPRDGWAAVAEQLQRHHEQVGQQRRKRQHWLTGLAVAATVTLVAGIVSILPQVSVGPTHTENTVADVGGAQAPTQNAVAAEAAPTGAGQDVDNLASLRKLSQRLEQNLAVLRTGVGAMPAEMVVYQVELEDLVAQVDAAISQQPDSSELWQQRVSLLLDLNQIYGAGLRRDEPSVASL